MTQTVVGRPLPPPRRDTSRWTPVGVAAIISALLPLAQAWRANAEERAQVELALSKAKSLELQVAELSAQLERTKRAHGETADTLMGQLRKLAGWQAFADASFCALGARPPYGCPDVEYAPRPLRGSSAPPIQPRVNAEPLDLDQ